MEFYFVWLTDWLTGIQIYLYFGIFFFSLHTNKFSTKHLQTRNSKRNQFPVNFEEEDDNNNKKKTKIKLKSILTSLIHFACIQKLSNFMGPHLFWLVSMANLCIESNSKVMEKPKHLDCFSKWFVCVCVLEPHFELIFSQKYPSRISD